MKIVELDNYINIYHETCSRNEVKNELTLLKYVAKNGNDLLDIFEGKVE